MKHNSRANGHDRPIIFSVEMVRAILEERKTQTRRVVRPQPIVLDSGQWFPGPPGSKRNALHYANEKHMRAGMPKDFCPYGQPGDRLWVRETWQIFDVAPPFDFDDPCHIEYKADTGNKYPGDWPDDFGDDEDCPRWSSPIHMPRDASRITLEITGVRVERVQDMSEDDAIAEGMEVVPVGTATWSNRQSFNVLWDSINTKRGFSWDRNPWVWVIEFNLKSIQRSSQFSE